MPLETYELMDLCDAVEARIDNALVPAIMRANITGELNDLLELLGMGDLATHEGRRKHGIVVIVGDSELDEKRARRVAKAHGINGDRLECHLEYDWAKRCKIAKFRNNPAYGAVLVGPMPHSAPGKGDSSSVITEMENHPESYPTVIRMQDSHRPKITKSSLERALDELSLLAG